MIAPDGVRFACSSAVIGRQPIPASSPVVAASRPLRVAFVSYEYPPHIEGGAGVYADCLTRELMALGHSVSIFTPKRGSQRYDGGVIAVGGAGTRAVGFWAALPAALLRTSVLGGSFDVIHGNALADLSLPRSVFPAARVVTLHHVTRRVVPPGFGGVLHRLRDCRGETGISPTLEKMVLRHADRVICVSYPVMDDAVRLRLVTPDQATVVPNGMRKAAAPDASLVESVRKAYCRDGESLLLNVGRLEYRKGTSTLLETVAQLPRTNLVCAGDGPAGTYRELVRRFGIQDQVHFTGHVTDRVRDALYAACDVFVSASLHEGFGLTVFEAMAMGKPVAVTNTGAAAAGWVSQEHGAVVPPGDVTSLRDALARLLASSDLRHAIGMSNRAYVSGWVTWRQIAIQTERVYREAIATGERVVEGLMSR